MLLQSLRHGQDRNSEEITRTTHRLEHAAQRNGGLQAGARLSEASDRRIAAPWICWLFIALHPLAYAPGRPRTCDPRIRSPTLSPSELRGLSDMIPEREAALCTHIVHPPHRTRRTDPSPFLHVALLW